MGYKGGTLGFEVTADLTMWLASSIASGVLDTAVFESLRGLRRRSGLKKLAELKQDVLRELKRVKRKPNVSHADLELRVDRLFTDVEEGR